MKSLTQKKAAFSERSLKISWIPPAGMHTKCLDHTMVVEIVQSGPNWWIVIQALTSISANVKEK